MLSLFKQKRNQGVLGIEVRPDGVALSVRRSSGDGSVESTFISCNAASRASELKQYMEQTDLSTLALHFVLPYEQYKVFPIDRPDVDQPELVEASKWRVKDMIDFDVSDAVVDVFMGPESPNKARPAKLHVVVAKQAIIRELVDLAEELELDLKSIDIQDFALVGVLTRQYPDEDRTIGLLYLRPNGGGTLVIVKQGVLCLARHFKFSAESLLDVSSQDSVTQYLALEVQRSFDYLESQIDRVPPQELIIVGPDPNIPIANMLGGALGTKAVNLNLPETGEYLDMVGLHCLSSIGVVFRGAES